LRAFRARSARLGVRLDLRTQLLYDARDVYLNGARIGIPRALYADVRRLADERALAGARCRVGSEPLIALLHDWYLHGYVELPA